MTRTLILFGSTTGQTEQVAHRIARLLPGQVQVSPVGAAVIQSMPGFDLILLGTSTWGSGELQDDWASLVGHLPALDLTGRKVALFGLGDASTYGETFVDGLGDLHLALCGTGAQRVGLWPTEGYAFEASRAIVDGRFAGLVLDEDNQPDQTDARIHRWAQSLQEA